MLVVGAAEKVETFVLRNEDALPRAAFAADEVGDVDLANAAGVARLTAGVDALLAKVRKKYKEYGIKEKAFVVVKADNLEAAVDQLKAKHVGLVVMVNKYDGIDLPNDACRILVLDGLPQARRSYERIETNMLAGSAHVIGRQIQRIEQGMGRGIRANDDYCVVLLMGSSLTRTMFTMGAKEMFSPATRAQLKKSLEVAEQLGGGVDELDSAIEVCLQQGTDWKKVAREAVANIG